MRRGWGLCTSRGRLHESEKRGGRGEGGEGEGRERGGRGEGEGRERGGRGEGEGRERGGRGEGEGRERGGRGEGEGRERGGRGEGEGRERGGRGEGEGRERGGRGSLPILNRRLVTSNAVNLMQGLTNEQRDKNTILTFSRTPRKIDHCPRPLLWVTRGGGGWMKSWRGGWQ